jgi:hypothetical protein
MSVAVAGGGGGGGGGGALSERARQVRQLAAGAASGIVTKTAVAPLERVKILKQLEGMVARAAAGTVSDEARARARAFHGAGVGQSVARIVREEGVRGLWKGNGANVVRVVPVYALKFAANDHIRAALSPAGARGADLPASRLMAAGTLAGLFQQTCTYPLEVIRTRLTMAGTFGERYRGIGHCAASVLAREGAGAFYKGITVTWLSGGPYVGIQMTAYTMLHRTLSRGASPDAWTSVANKLVSGAAAGLVAQTITFPGDTVRRRMQTNGAGGAERAYRNSLDCVRQMVRAEGVGSLFSGLRANVLRAVPGAAIQFLAYDTFKHLLLGEEAHHT